MRPIAFQIELAATLAGEQLIRADTLASASIWAPASEEFTQFASRFVEWLLALTRCSRIVDRLKLYTKFLQV